jgi:hypothetical protein
MCLMLCVPYSFPPDTSPHPAHACSTPQPPFLLWTVWMAHMLPPPLSSRDFPPSHAGCYLSATFPIVVSGCLVLWTRPVTTRFPFHVFMYHPPSNLLIMLRPPCHQTMPMKLPFRVFHPTLLLFHVIAMTRFLFRALCLLVFPPLFARFVALDPPRRLQEALADALLDMGNIDVHLLHPRLSNTLHNNIHLQFLTRHSISDA